MDLSRLQQLPTVETWVWLTVVGVAAVALAVVVTLVLARRRRRRRVLQRRYGAEYEHTVRRAGSRRRADQQLVEREDARNRYEVRELGADERRDVHVRWAALQAGFLDDPWPAVRGADELVGEVAASRGYPAPDPLAGVSVDHPTSVDRYRAAGRRVEDRGIDATTEQLRRAMLAARDLVETLVGSTYADGTSATSSFRELLEDDGDEDAGEPTPALPLYGPDGRLLWGQQSNHPR